MKPVIFTIFLFAVSLKSTAQHTLAFNQTLLLTSGNTYTVPANATWKVESILFNSYANDLFYSNTNYYPTFNITPPGGSPTTVYYMGVGYNGLNPTTASSIPCWLPAGTTIQATGATSMVSVIEFIIQ